MATKMRILTRGNLNFAGFNATVAPDSALQLSYFGIYGGVIRNVDANTAVTFNDDMKTGQVFKMIVNNTHVSSNISVSFPDGTKGHPLPAFISAGKFVEFSMQWVATYWKVLYTGVLS